MLDHIHTTLDKLWRIEHKHNSDGGYDDEDGDEKAELMAVLIEEEKYDK